MVSSILLFIVGLIFLIKGGDWFVDGASNIAEKFKMPEILIGATVVSIGTTLPEVMVSASSAVSGHGEIAYGNAIGSIICNTALIAAITVAVYPSKVERRTLITPVIFFFVSATFYSVIAYIRGRFTRLTGVMFLLIFVVYMVFTVRQAFKDGDRKSNSNSLEAVTDQSEVMEAQMDSENAEKDEPRGWFQKYKESHKEVMWFQIAMLVVGAILIAVGANLLVENGTIIAVAMGVPESVIALTMVALGTSLPELVTAITSLVKGCGALSLGNVIGANLFNIVLVCGMSCTLSPFDVPKGNLIAGLPTSLVLEIPLMFFVMAFLTIPALIKGELKKYQGVTLLCIYAAFVLFQFLG